MYRDQDHLMLHSKTLSQDNSNKKKKTFTWRSWKRREKRMRENRFSNVSLLSPQVVEIVRRKCNYVTVIIESWAHTGRMGKPPSGVGSVDKEESQTLSGGHKGERHLQLPSPWLCWVNQVKQYRELGLEMPRKLLITAAISVVTHANIKPHHSL